MYQYAPPPRHDPCGITTSNTYEWRIKTLLACVGGRIFPRLNDTAPKIQNHTEDVPRGPDLY